MDNLPNTTGPNESGGTAKFFSGGVNCLQSSGLFVEGRAIAHCFH